jgi:hypothetical protein
MPSDGITIKDARIEFGRVSETRYVTFERKLNPRGTPRPLSVWVSVDGFTVQAVYTVTQYNSVQQVKRNRVNGDLFDAVCAEARELAAEAERIDAMAQSAAEAAEPVEAAQPPSGGMVGALAIGDDFPY